MFKFPNRTGESALYKTGSPAYIDLSSIALPAMRTFAQAQADGSLSDGDIVGVSIVGPTGWGVWEAEFNETDGYLVQLSAETAHGSLANDDVCDVVACITEAQMLNVFARLPELEPPVFDGPEYWWHENENERLVWDASDEWYIHPGGNSTFYLTPVGTWADGYRPSQMTCEIYIPAGTNGEFARVEIVHGINNNEFITAIAGSGYLEDDWNTLVLDLSSLSTDIFRLGFGISGPPPPGYLLRNIKFS